MSDEARPGLSGGLVLLMAVACGTMVANLYYAQTLIGTIAPAIGLPPRLGGLITTLTQLGYGAGLALLVPLGDRIENRRLVLIATAATVLASLGIALAQGPLSFLAASLVTGMCATSAQVMVPLAAHLSAREREGRTIGLVMSGLLAGIMLARPLASFGAALAGWRAVFFASAALMTLVGLALAYALPRYRTEARHSYWGTLKSTVAVARRYRALRLRALYQALLFAAFNLFWTAAPLALMQHFGLGQRGVALFALAGAGGALAAPIAGRMADHGRVWFATLAAMAVLVIGFLAAGWAVAAGSLIAFAVTGFAIDAAVQVNQVSGQTIIFGLDRSARARVNAAYMTAMFAVGALGSLIGSASYEVGGWTLAAGLGAAIGATALAALLLLDRGASRQ